MATAEQRQSRLRTAIQNSANRKGIKLTEQALDAMVERAYGHVINRTKFTESRDGDVADAQRNVDTFMGQIKAYKATGTFTSVDFRSFVKANTNCLYPFCRPTK